MKREHLLIVLSMLVLAFFLVRMFDSGNLATGPQRTKELIYSDFKALVASGDVVNAQLVGDSLIEGFTQDGLGYRTYIPAEDPSVVDFLRLYQIPINYVPEKSLPWYLSILINWGPFLLIFGIWMVLMRRMQGGGGGAGGGGLFSIGRSRAKKMEPDEMKVTFADVAGIEEAKDDLSETVEFLKDPAKFKKLGGRIPKGMLMSGAPGTGKTLLAKAVAGEAEVPFFSMSGSDFVEMFVGVGASRVRDMFEQGRQNAPCIIFIDEIDAVGGSRGAGMGGGNDEREQTLNQLLVEMDGFDGMEGIIVIAATNRPDVLDPALLRPGRFDRQVTIQLPDVKGREEILLIHAKKVQMADGVDMSIIARGTPGFSGADLKNLINEAALGGARKNKTELNLEDFEWARDKVLMGTERKSMAMSEKEKRNTAYHEAGHALVSALLPNSDPIHKVTIVPRGRALGMTAYLPEKDNHSFDIEFLSNRITIAMGGRAAEEIIFDEVTTGASNDIQQATNTIRNMICRWGMSKSFGPVVFGSDNQSNVLGRDIGKDREYSENTATEIDKEMRKTIKFHDDKAKELLRSNIDTLHKIVDVLMEKETIDGSKILELLGQKKSKVEPVGG
ncbi:MAG: ATP-dependent metallopeptidase FtsH/Yme1/Tma family protein [SAR324 cluster bacterium]|nr:ATP-dependent metallopeptidase FtsH/Yme1/Tma family protein [SAR324 cluster bacterium]MBL7035416.1 ATP-dependent zinc metalloprotease FtsH [SAR324 cluster bacterium]